MSTRPLIPLILVLAASLVEGSERPSHVPTTGATISFEEFLKISGEVFEARQDRLVPLDEFLELAARPDTVLLDTRSAAAYEAKHLAGAVHLNFSDFTEESLARTVGPRDRVVLIYCNNNFTGNQSPFVTKKPPAALNIPTFVSLWAYGYRNVYELGELLDLSDERLDFEGRLAGAAR